ncbi:MAG: twin transmembrane helix small protein [Rubellimicrobium sp.]|nr:twin transmembrane helix small protein [Rubellimicrobium sp.]
MLSDPFFLVAGAAVLVVLLILIVGIISFARGGNFDRRNANRLMRWRVGAQLLAVLVILLLAWIRRGAI